MRYLVFIIALFAALQTNAQNNIVYGAGINYTNGAPTFTPPVRTSRVAIDTVTGKWYHFNTPGGWQLIGNTIEEIAGCTAPAYTPGKGDSKVVINNCSPQPELYFYNGSAWVLVGGGSVYAGEGIRIENDTIILDSLYVLRFRTGSNTDGAAGTMSWNTTEETVDLVTDQGTVTGHLMESAYYNTRNTTGTPITIGTVVMANGTTGNTGRILIAPAIADGSVNSEYILGLAAQTIGNNSNGKVQHFGKIRGIQTNGANYGETWVDGDVLYCSAVTPGYLTKVLPNAPNLKVPIAIVIHAHPSNGTLFVRPSHFPDLAQINDVELSSPTNGQVLTYNSTLSRWENATPANQLQTLSTDNTPGNISISSGNTITLNVNDADASATNELQTLSTGTNTLTLSNGGGTVTVDTDPANDVTGSGTTNKAAFWSSSSAIDAASWITQTTNQSQNSLTLDGSILINQPYDGTDYRFYSLRAVRGSNDFRIVMPASTGTDVVSFQSLNSFNPEKNAFSFLNPFAWSPNANNQSHNFINIREVPRFSTFTGGTWRGLNYSNTYNDLTQSGNVVVNNFNIGGTATAGSVINTTGVNIDFGFGQTGATGITRGVRVSGIATLADFRGYEVVGAVGLNGIGFYQTGTLHNRFLGSLNVGQDAVPAARINVVGSGNTSGTWTAQFHNSGGNNNALMIRDDGRIGMGTNAPSANLDVSGDQNTFGYGDGIRITGFGTTANYRTVLGFYRAKGTQAAPAETVANDVIGSFSFFARKASGQYVTTATIRSVQTANHTLSTSVTTGNLEFFTADGTNEAARMTLDPNGRLNIGTTTSNNSAILNVTSTTMGILFPRMTTAQRDLIATPADGLVIYNTTDNKLQVRAAGAWVDLH